MASTPVRSLVAAAALGAAGAVAAPCDSPEHRQFDFWIGEWNVFTPDGKQAGTNSIKREYGGCVLHERYDTAPRTYAGESLNIYDATRKVWHQSWVDNSGLLLLLEGGFANGRMVMEGPGVTEGKPVRHRISWTPNPDGTVRELWETAGSDGKWAVAFDGQYRRK